MSEGTYFNFQGKINSSRETEHQMMPDISPGHNANCNIKWFWLYPFLYLVEMVIRSKRPFDFLKSVTTCHIILLHVSSTVLLFTVSFSLIASYNSNVQKKNLVSERMLLYSQFSGFPQIIRNKIP